MGVSPHDYDFDCLPFFSLVPIHPFIVVKTVPKVTNGKVMPVRGPQHLGKIQLRERRYIRSMIGIDSRNVGVQAELDPVRDFMFDCGCLAYLLA